MDTLKINKGQTKIIAHRGVSGIERQNTNLSFVAAGNRSYFGIETDVHVTKDNVMVIIHDDNTSNVSNVNVNVEKSTYDQLKNIYLYDYNNIDTRRDLIIPVLSDYIEICKRYEKKAVLELKNHMEKDSILKIIDIINCQDYLDETIIISFDWDNLIQVRNIINSSTVQFLTCECNDTLIDKLYENKFDIDIQYASINKEFVDKLHSKGIKVNCWTCDTVEEANYLINCNVDYLTTNILE